MLDPLTRLSFENGGESLFWSDMFRLLDKADILSRPLASLRMVSGFVIAIDL
jgi:hypothetical protein